jgi:Zn-dependent metalloprotease
MRLKTFLVGGCSAFLIWLNRVGNAAVLEKSHFQQSLLRLLPDKAPGLVSPIFKAEAALSSHDQKGEEMKLRKRFLAASFAAIPLLPSSNLQAASPMSASPQPSLMMAGPVAQSAQEAAALLAKLNGARGKYGLDQNHGYRPTVQHPGGAGTRIVRLAHTYKGVRIFQSESVVVTNDAGDMLSESASDRRSGLGSGAGAKVSARYANFNVTPKLSSRAALARAPQSIAPNPASAAPPRPELIIYPIVERVRVQAAANKADAALNAMDLAEQVTGYELAYLVQTRLVVGGRPVYRDTIVSARDGRVIAQWDALQTMIGVGNSQYNGQAPLSTTQTGDAAFSMRDPLRGVNGAYGANAVTDANHGSRAGEIYTNSTNTWGDGQNYIPGGSTTNANGQTAAVNAMWGLMNTYDTLKNVLGWQSLDGQNSATYIAAHVFNNYDNAYYDDTCKCMFIGDGGTAFTSLGSIDVIGHEMGHGVTAATSNLTYAGESGGLNESASDINGEVTEAYARAGGTGNLIPNTGNDWLMGQEISRSGTPLRWMYKPSKDGRSPDAWSSTIGRLDVHYSSGPNNRMFYFLSQGSNAGSTSDYYSAYLTRLPRAMTGIGSDKAYRIWFRALTTKFIASTNYADARNKVIAAAEELYGAGSKEAIAAQRAYAAINVGADIDEAATGGPVAIGAQPQGVTVAVGATATFSVTAAGGTPAYSYQWMRNGVDIAGATSSSYSLTAQASDNGAAFSVRVTDSASPSTTATSSGATLTVTSGTAAERVANGSFESGAAGWSGTTSVIDTWTALGRSPYDGSYFAYLGGNGRLSSETLTQVVTIPTTATSAQLSYALNIDTAEMTATVPYDRLTVTVRNPAGTVLGTLATYSNLDKTTGYQIRSFDLLPYKGQSVMLSFVMNEDFSLQTSFTLDKVSLLTQ